MTGLTIKNAAIALAGAAFGAAVTAAGFLTFGGSHGDVTATTTSTSTPTSSTSSTTATTNAAVKTSGVLPKKLGEQAGYGCPTSGTGTCAVQFTLDKVTDCTGNYPGDDLGPGRVRKLAWFSVRTGSTFNQNPGAGTYVPSFSAYNVHAVNSAGVTGGSIGASTTWECAVSGDRLPLDWAPGQAYTGAVEIYVPTDTKKLVLTLGQIGWSWDY